MKHPKFIINQYKVKTIKKDSPDFYFSAGITRSPRAGFEVMYECPDTYKRVIMECIQNGWLKPVAYMRDNEFAWDKLGE